MPPFARSNLPGACHAAEGRRLIADGDGIGAIVRTLATAGEKHEERQGLKLALTTALIRLSIGEDHELRAKIIDAGALPLLIKLMDTSAGELSHNLQHCAAACLVRISDCAQSNLRTNLKADQLWAHCRVLEAAFCGGVLVVQRLAEICVDVSNLHCD